MEHAEARELLEIAALEPGGFERLTAGDTPEAAAIAGHIAGCVECATEMERLRRASVVIRGALRESPPADLRDRTLAFVAAVGRPRVVGATAVPMGSAATPIDLDRASGARQTVPRVSLWVAALAAAVVIAIAGTSLYVARSNDSLIAAQSVQIASLAKVATWSLRIDGQKDAMYVELAATNGNADVAGTLAFAPRTSELVVVAQGLAQPPSDMQYRCWVEMNGSRKRIGQMFFGGDVAYWVGKVDGIGGVGPGTRFGVSLVPVGGDSVAADPVLLGHT
jgi:hypothetical protein